MLTSSSGLQREHLRRWRTTAQRWNGVPRGGRPEDLKFSVRDELPGTRGGGAAEGGVVGRKQAHEARTPVSENKKKKKE